MGKSIKKNLLYQSLYQILMVFSPLITSPYIARTLGNEKYGTYSFYYSIAYYFGIFAILGMANYGNRTIAKIKTQGQKALGNVFSELVFLQFIMTGIVSILYFATIAFWGGEYKFTAIIEWMYILSVGLDISWFYFGIEDFKTTTLRSFIVKVGMIISILFFVKTPDDLNVYTVIMAGGMLISIIVLWVRVPNYIKFQKIKIKYVIPHIRPNIILFIPVISLALFHYSDKIMLGAMSSWVETGYYTNADKVVNIPMGLINGLGVVMLPRISSLHVSNEDNKIRKYINISILISVWGGTALCFGIIAICNEFVPFFFGNGYERCIELLNLLSIVVLIKAISNVLRTQYLIPMEKDIQFNLSVIIAAIINIIFNYLFIPQYGALGAVYGTLIAESVVLISYLWFSRNMMNYKAILFPLCGFVISGIIMLISVKYIKTAIASKINSNFIMLIIEVLIGAGIYCILSCIVFIISKRRIHLLLE